MQQEIQEEEALQAPLIQVVSEKKVEQHGLLLRRNVKGVEAVPCLSLRMQCKTVISRAFQAFSQTILFFIYPLIHFYFLLLVLLQKAQVQEQSFPLHLLETSPCSEDRFQSLCLCISPSVPCTVRASVAPLL